MPDSPVVHRLSVGDGSNRRRRTGCGQSHHRRAGVPATPVEAHRLGELRLTSRPARHGQLAVGQVRRRHPGHRFYAGCEMVDRIETLAADHAKALFGAEHAYVQPHSGIDANLVAYWAILAHRIEQPVLAEAAGVDHVNDLDAVAWEDCATACTPSA